MAEPSYATVESLRSKLIGSEDTTQDQDILDALQAATQTVPGYLKRTCFPEYGTRYFDWPGQQTSATWRVELVSSDLWSLTSAVAGGVPMTLADLILEPNYAGPPYDSVQFNLAGRSVFQAGSTFQQAVAFTGLWGYLGDNPTVGTMTAGISASDATVTMTAGSKIMGVGATLGIGTELLIVTGRQSADTGAQLTGGVAADVSTNLIPVTSTTGFVVGETITVDTERMRVRDITTGLLVDRAADGTTLASHSNNAHVWAVRTWSVDRGQLGSTAAAHLSTAPVTRYRAPSLVESYTIAHAMMTGLQDKAGWMTTSRSGAEGGTKVVTAAALEDLAARMRSAHTRLGRSRVV